jgi:hypothetical protein
MTKKNALYWLGVGWVVAAAFALWFYEDGRVTALVLISTGCTHLIGSLILEEMQKLSKPRCPRAHLENHNPSACIICLNLVDAL